MFDRLNISAADIPCVLENDVRKTARSTQPVTLYISVDITPPTLYSSPSSIPTGYDCPAAEEAPMPGRIQSPSLEHPLLPSHHQPAEADNNKSQSRKELSPATAKNLPLDLRRADEATERINRSNTCQGVVRRIKWVMDTLGPIAEVRVIPFLMSLAGLTCTFSSSHLQRWRTVYFRQFPRYVHFCYFLNETLTI